MIDLYRPGSRLLPLTDNNQDLNRPSNYIAEQALIDAVNVALLLGQPLLVTGAPGTGKTQLAYSVAWELLGTVPLKFEVKSTTIARDLFYTYDALSRFQAVQSGTKTDPLDHFKVNALGLAIVLSHPPERADLRPKPLASAPAQRSVVLIDEIDKAPRDFPNDLLNEIENLYFKVPELGNREVRASPEQRPIVIITSNSERDLPDAFLRRCVFFHIPFPEKRLKDIVESRLGSALKQAPPLLDAALEGFLKLRGPGAELRKPPSTSELLHWLKAMLDHPERSADPFKRTNGVDPIALRTITALAKNEDDLAQTDGILREWLKRRQASP